MLEMEHVTFRYSKETPVILSDVSVSFGKGEFYRLCISTAGAANVHAYCSGRNWFRPLSAGEAWQ